MSPNSDSLTGSRDQSGADSPSRPGHVLWDRLGIVGSAVCVVHCVGTSIVIGALSTVGLGFVDGEVLHKILTVPLLLVAFMAFLPGYRCHGNKKILATGVAGIVALLSAVFVFEPLHAHTLSNGVSVLGSLLLIGGHGANWRLTSRRHSCCHDE